MMKTESRVMSHESRKIRSFTDLNSWRGAHSLTVKLYRVTRSFPKEELFGLTSQMRRAAVSITSNIAEGFSRKTSSDREHFYTMARGSLTELQSQLLLARDIEYLHSKDFNALSQQSIEVHKVLTGLINSTKEMK